MTERAKIDLADPLLALPRPVKRLLVLLVDVLLCITTVWLAFYVRLDQWIRLYDDPFWRGDIACMISVAVAIPLFVTHGFYRVIFRHANLVAINLVVRAFLIYWALFALIITAVGIPGIPRTVGIIQPILLVIGVGLSRALAHYWLGGAYQRILQRANLPKALIYGAGEAGRQLALAMVNSQEMRVVGFLDDDPALQGHVLQGLRVYSPVKLTELIESQGIHSVLLALPSISRQRRNEILTQIQSAKISVRTLPSVSDLVQGKVAISDLRELDIEDLLGRDPVPPRQELLQKNIASKVVMVTGAGGSIGSQLCRQILEIGPRKLVLFEQSEFALYQIHAELEKKLVHRPTELVCILGSVQSRDELDQAIRTQHPDTIYHAAAYKHVPLVEGNPIQGIRNNVYGTLATVESAIEHGVSDFVLISTDKAVRPTNVMGASKRLSEMVLQALAQQQSTCRLTMVRFGNVLDSSGSVVPKFRQQIRDGGPVTVTDPEVTRYFMTIPEAAELVIQAGAMSRGGEVYVLDMGQPVKIIDLAHRMVELSGLTVKDESNPDGDIRIDIIGLRPGEKLYEELLIGDNPEATEHPRIMRASETYLPWDKLHGQLMQLKHLLDEKNATAVHQMLRELVIDYRPKDSGAKLNQ